MGHFLDAVQFHVVGTVRRSVGGEEGRKRGRAEQPLLWIYAPFTTREAGRHDEALRVEHVPLVLKFPSGERARKEGMLFIGDNLGVAVVVFR